MPPPGDFLKFARILVLPVLMAAQGEAAPPSAALRQRLAELVRPEFEVIAWSPTYYADIGLVYDNRAEPCAREIAILQKKAADAPKDAATRQRLGWLLNRHGVPRSGDRWIAEAVRICQQQLVKDGNDEEALARLAILRAGTEEAEQAARKATELHPNSWRAWDALARHQWRKLEQRVLGNLPMSLQEMAIADAPRLERALAAHAADPDLTDALLKLNAEREV
ncbi:MAG TPA: hypothetical protein VD994_14785, partial [Prosthecobacter sp.]|nr:hypothetical protein [Prosthecobacter sp.]